MSPLLGTVAAASSKGYGPNDSGPQIAYTSPGTYTFVVPPSVTSIIALAVGGGQGGCVINGGIGGRLSYNNAISVTPGESLTVQVGAGGDGRDDSTQNNGGDSSIKRNTTTLLLAAGGGSSTTNVGTVTYAGGNGSVGGGSAAGYSAAGRNGGGFSFAGTAGTGGSPGSGGGGTIRYNVPNTGDEQVFPSGGGGGVGIFGTGSNGAAGTAGTVSVGAGGGGGGSGGNNGLSADADPEGVAGNGGQYGGGGGGGGRTTYSGVTTGYFGGNGGNGAVRILWGGGRSYPSNAADL